MRQQARYACTSVQERHNKGMQRICSTTVKKSENGEAANAILEGAVRIACTEGLGGVTVRAVARTAQVAPSAVIYHFKTVAGLLNAVHGHIGQVLAEWRADALHSLQDPAGHLFSAEALSVAALSDLVGALGLQIILQKELNRAALRGTLDLDVPPIAAVKARADFWQALMQAQDANPAHARARGLVADGLLPLVLLDRLPFRRAALIAAVMRRVNDRLARRHVEPIRSEAVLPQTSGEPAAPRGKQQIIEAAIRLIGREGADRLTHRKVAADAGLSLASTTYFYASKEDLIVDAFSEIQRRAVHAVVQAATPRHQFISSVLLNEAGEERWEMAAMTELNYAAIRSARLDGLALTLRQVRGIDGMRWLRAHGRADADHLDGILWSAATTPIADHALCLPPPERRDFLDRETAQAFDILFGAA